MRHLIGIFARMFVLLLVSSVAQAGRPVTALYGGGGLERSSLSLKVAGIESNFTAWGGHLQAGFIVNFSDTWTGFLEGEYGRTEGLNTFQSVSYLEKITNSYITAKAGLTYSILTVGAGARQNQIDIDSVQTSTAGIRSSYKGLSYLTFGQLSLNTDPSFKTIIEIQYGGGALSDLELTEASIGLRLIFFPFLN